jgi:protein disulfide-isomerase
MNLRFLPAAVVALSLSASAFAKTGWEDDFEKGLAKAKAENKLALVDFTGSDWCIWCKRLDGEIFSKAKFKEYVKDKYVLIEVDFPQMKKLTKKRQEANNALAEKYKVSGYPTVVVLDGEANEVGRLGYTEGGPEAFIAKLEEKAKK